MPETANLADRIEKQLPAELIGFIQQAGRLAAGRGERLYLVGGGVRDLLLGEANLDIDLVVAGDALALARKLAGAGKLTVHRRFNTAKLQWRRWSVDLAAARSETYARPGALPTIKPGSLADDLFRRDFSINAMAIELSPEGYGQLIDLYGGRDDLNNRLIRILHDKSFSDDATRIWRGLRYEQRLGFKLEGGTLRLLKRDVPLLDSISGDRIRYELECVFGEQYPETALKRAEELGPLSRISLSFRGNGWLAERFSKARRLSSPNQPALGLYLALLAYPLKDKEMEPLISYLRLPRILARTLRDSGSIRARLQELADPELSPSGIYHLLHGYSPQAITANLLVSESPQARRHIQQYLDKLRYLKPALGGDDLIRMGVTQGPRIKEILNRLHDARLDGRVTTKQDEEKLVRGWLKGG